MQIIINYRKRKKKWLQSQNKYTKVLNLLSIIRFCFKKHTHRRRKKRRGKYC